MCVLESITSFFPLSLYCILKSSETAMGDDTLCMKSIVRFPLKSSVTLCLLFQKKISPDTFDLNAKKTRCLEITENVSFYIENEASYVYILSGPKIDQKC